MMVVKKSMGLPPDMATGAYIPTVSTCLKLKHACKEEGPVSGRRPVNGRAFRTTFAPCTIHNTYPLNHFSYPQNGKNGNGSSSE